MPEPQDLTVIYARALLKISTMLITQTWDYYMDLLINCLNGIHPNIQAEQGKNDPISKEENTHWSRRCGIYEKYQRKIIFLHIWRS